MTDEELYQLKSGDGVAGVVPITGEAQRKIDVSKYLESGYKFARPSINKSSKGSFNPWNHRNKRYEG